MKRLLGGVLLAALVVAIAVLLLRSGTAPPDPGRDREPDAAAAAEGSRPRRGDGTSRDAAGAADDAGGRPEASALAVTGRVVDARARPVPGAELQLLATATQREVADARAGDDGDFRLVVEQAGTFDLAASDPAAGAAWIAAIAVTSGERDLGDVMLLQRAPLAGRLVYADGQPVTAFAVRAHAAGGGPFWSAAGLRGDSTVTDAAGRFGFRNLAPGRYRLRLSELLLREGERPSYELTTGEPESDVVVDLHRIRVRGVDDGIGCDGWSEEHGDNVQRAVETGFGWLELQQRTGVSAAGRITDVLVPRGSWWHVSYSEGLMWREAMVHADRARNETEVDLEPRPVSLSATLRLRLGAGDAAAPGEVEVARIQALAFGSFPRSEPAGRDGDDFLFRTPPGRYRITLQPDPDRLRRSPFFPIEQDVEMRAGQETVVAAAARRGGRIGLTVHVPDGGERPRGLHVTLPAAGGAAPIRLGPYQNEPRPGHFSSRGRAPFETPFVCLRLLPPGRHEVVVVADGFAPQRVGVFVTAGEVTSTEVWLQR